MTVPSDVVVVLELDSEIEELLLFTDVPFDVASVPDGCAFSVDRAAAARFIASSRTRRMLLEMLLLTGIGDSGGLVLDEERVGTNEVCERRANVRRARGAALERRETVAAARS